jgi:rhodanese-related sulfurtransferase
VATAVAGLSLHRQDEANGRGPSGTTEQRLAADAEQADDAALAADVQRRYGAMKLLQFPEQPEITVAEWVARSADRPAVLVDVREPHERRVSMLPGAITREDFERNSARYRSWVVVPYCTIGVRSGHYTRTLRSQGFEARNLAGSALAWAHAGLPFEADGKVTRRVHVFNAAWNLLPEGYEPVVSAAPALEQDG